MLGRLRQSFNFTGQVRAKARSDMLEAIKGEIVTRRTAGTQENVISGPGVAGGGILGGGIGGGGIL